MAIGLDASSGPQYDICDYLRLHIRAEGWQKVDVG